MLRRGCTLILVLFGALFALYFFFFTRYFEWPGNLFAAGLGSLSAASGSAASATCCGRGATRRAFRARGPQANRRRTAARRRRRPHPSARRAADEPVLAAGRAWPTNTKSSSNCPLARADVVAADRHRRVRDGGLGDRHARRPRAAARLSDPRPVPAVARLRARRGGARRRYAALGRRSRRCSGLGALQMSRVVRRRPRGRRRHVRKDFRMTDEAIPFEQPHARRAHRRGRAGGVRARPLRCREARARARAARRSTGSGRARRRRSAARSSATARSQALLGLTFFAVSHAMLGPAFYLSETRYARESEDRQASAIRSARAGQRRRRARARVRQGANPNARDTFGDAVLLDVREPAMAAALVRLGADVNVRHRDDATRRSSAPRAWATSSSSASCSRRTPTCTPG